MNGKFSKIDRTDPSILKISPVCLIGTISSDKVSLGRDSMESAAHKATHILILGSGFAAIEVLKKLG